MTAPACRRLRNSLSWRFGEDGGAAFGTAMALRLASLAQDALHAEVVTADPAVAGFATPQAADGVARRKRRHHRKDQRREPERNGDADVWRDVIRRNRPAGRWKMPLHREDEA